MTLLNSLGQMSLLSQASTPYIGERGSSTLENRVAVSDRGCGVTTFGGTLADRLSATRWRSSFGFPPVGERAYGRDAEAAITEKLRQCDVRFLPMPPAEIAETQADLIRALDPPMNDHPGQVPRWRIAEVREILEIG